MYIILSVLLQTLEAKVPSSLRPANLTLVDSTTLLVKIYIWIVIQLSRLFFIKCYVAVLLQINNYFRATDFAAPIVVTVLNVIEEFQALTMRLAANLLTTVWLRLYLWIQVH